MENSTTKILLEFIRVYLETLEKSRRGEMAEFGRKYNIPAATLTRIKQGKEGYIPESEAIFDCLRGICHKSFIDFGGMQMDKVMILPLIQLADILTHKDLVSPALWQTLIDLLGAIHKELVTKWQIHLRVIN